VIPVFALARVIGTTPNRQWLIYAFSPQANRTDVQVTIPGYRAVSINATIAGAFSLADEASGSVSAIAP
jgi:phospholipase C